MPLGVRFDDVLDEALRAGGWEIPAANEPVVTSRTASARPVVCTPLYNLHTLSLDAIAPTPATSANRVADATSCTVTTKARLYESARDSMRATPADRTQATDARSARPPLFHTVKPRAFRLAQPGRRLTLAQRRSLDVLNEYGARISADFSAVELRSAYRLLARDYHPDRHPGVGEQDRQRLSRQFTAIRTSYETLLTALDPVTPS